MQKLNFKIISNKILPIVNKVQKSKIVNGIIGGMMWAMPITLVGAFSAFFLNLPLPVWKDFIVNVGIASVFKTLIMYSTNFLAVIFGVAIAESYAKQFEEEGTFVGLLTLMCFFIVTPAGISDKGTASIPMQWLGATGIFTAIIVSLVATRVYIYVKQRNVTIQMPESVPPVVASSFNSLIPGFASVILFGIISAFFSGTQYQSMHEFIYTFLQTPLMNVGGSIISIVVLWTFAQVLWFLGIHGTMVVYSVVLPIFTAMDVAQLAAYAAGDALPNITGRAFISTYTMSASAIGLALLMLFTAKSKQYQTLGKLTTVPALFGISEPLVFGTPLVLNFRFAIPFIFMNGINLIIAYFLTYIEIVPRVLGMTPIAGMPIILSGFMEGSWKIAVLQVVLVGLELIVWYPFFRKADQEAYDLEQNEELEAVQ